jgi:hypothetical protein
MIAMRMNLPESQLNQIDSKTKGIILVVRGRVCLFVVD